MGPIPVYAAIARAFAAEGVTTHFTLLGHGQMRWAIALDDLPGTQAISARHEHCACAMAVGYHSATGEVGIASVTCGPGFTQIMTALTWAAHARVPLVVFAADNPVGTSWNNQDVDQTALARATGARIINALSPGRMLDRVQEAFYLARTERIPVVLSVPYDLLDEPFPGEADTYEPSTRLIPRPAPMPPADVDVAALAEELASARSPVIIAGRGAVRAGAAPAIVALAAQVGALLATTLPARGLFDSDPFSIGVAGGYASELAMAVLAEADLVLAVGASLSYFTTSGGALFPKARVAQIDLHPTGRHHGRASAGIHLRADARLGVEALSVALAGRRPHASVRSPAFAARIAAAVPDPTPFEIGPGTVDPREAVQVLDDVIPKDWDIVGGSGHNAYFYTHMRHRSPERFHVFREFGAIGNGLAMAAGVAVARGTGQVVLLEGDGGLLMHIQELESIRRQGIRLLIICLNDGAYGAELHRIRKFSSNLGMAVFGRADLAAIANGFGLVGRTVTDANQIRECFEGYDPEAGSQLWNIHISDRVTAPRIR